MVDPNFLNHVGRLCNTLYDLRQALQEWYNALRGVLHSVGFVTSWVDTSMFVLYNANTLIYLSMWMTLLLQEITLLKLRTSFNYYISSSLSKTLSPCLTSVVLTCLQFHVDFSSIKESTSSICWTISPSLKLNRFPTPLVVNSWLCLHDGTSPFDVVNKLSLFMHAPNKTHWNTVKQLLLK